MEKLKNFQNKSLDLSIVFFIYRLSLGLLVRGVTGNIRQLLLGFFNRQKLVNRYKILVFRILKMCLVVPSSSHYYFMNHGGCAYKFKWSPNWEGLGVNLKSGIFFEKIYELKNFTCKKYWLIESSWFCNRFQSQNFWHFSAFPSIQLYFNGLVLFFPHQIEPSAHRGPVFKNFRSKKFLFKIIVSPLPMVHRLSAESIDSL